MIIRQEAVHFFRSGIEISMNILGGAVGGGVEAADAFDLGQGYDRLGLALKDAGASHAAVTETYMVGLSFVPEDTTLLINGGVAYQVSYYRRLHRHSSARDRCTW